MARRPPLVARALLRLVPLGIRRAETEGDLLELYEARARKRGHAHAGVRYAHDVISLVFRKRPAKLATNDVALTRHPLSGMGRDLVYALRLFARQPITMGITVLGLGLAIGVSGSIFTLMNAALLRSDGVRDSERAPRVLRTNPNHVATAWGYDEFLRLREAASQSLVEASITDATSFTLSSVIPDEPPSIPIAFVSEGYLEALYAKAIVGRLLSITDSIPSAPPVVVVSHAFWQRHLGSDPAAVGRALRVGRTSATVVGVAERSFAAPFTNGTGLWMPISAYHQVYASKPIGAGSTQPVAVVTRVKQGVPLAAAEAELTAIAGSFRTSNELGRVGARFDENSRLGRPPASQQLAITIAVMIVIALVLILACVNVASVLLANATTRQREIGVRLALGATRGRIIRQLLTESVMIAAAASSVGLLLTLWLGPVIKRLVRAPVTLDTGFDLNVYLFFVAVAFACGVGAGLAPARVGARGDLISPLKGPGTAAPTSAPRRLRSALLGVQAAASILLLVLATLFVRATIRAARVDVGFEAQHLVAVSVGIDRSTDAAARVKAYWASALEKVSALPDVESAALAELPPFAGASKVMIEERGGQRVVTYFNRTSANYFDTVGLRLIRGRTYTPAEVATDARVAVISETLVRRHWNGGDPLGSSLKWITEEDAVVIGVVSDAIVARIHEGTHAAIYQPMPPSQLDFARLVVRARGNPAQVARPVREALRTLDPSVVVRAQLVKDGLEEEISRPRIVALICGTMAVLAVVLAAIGLYGVTRAVVGQRTREIGLRMALGAERRDVERLLMRDSLRPVLAGLGIGVVLALLGGHAISGALFGVAPYDPIAFGGAIVILLTSATIAVLVPTRSAARVDPAFVLRQG